MSAEEFIDIIYLEKDADKVKAAHDEFMKNPSKAEHEKFAQSGAGEIFYLKYGYIGEYHGD